MTAAEAKAEAEKWERRLALEEWDIAYVFVEAASVETDGDLDVRGDARIDPPNREATVCLALSRPKRAIRGTIIHELCHIAAADLVLAGKRIMETLKDLGQRTLADHLGAVLEDEEEQLIRRFERAFVR